jgi:hypothetical protein
MRTMLGSGSAAATILEQQNKPSNERIINTPIRPGKNITSNPLIMPRAVIDFCGDNAGMGDPFATTPITSS